MTVKYVFNPTTGKIDATDKVAFNGEVTLGTAAAPSIFFTGDPNTGIYSPGADQVAISTNGTGQLFVDASGNVGIGQSSITAVFGRTVSTRGAAAATYRVAGASTSAYLFTSDGLGYGGILQETNHPLILGTNSLERLRITSDGKVGLGTSSPGSTIHAKGGSVSTPATVSDFISNATARFVVNHGNEYGAYIGYANGATDAIGIQSTTNIGGVRALLLNPYGGNVGVGNTVPSYEIDLGNVSATQNYTQRIVSGANYSAAARYDLNGIGTFTVGFNNSGSVVNNAPTGVASLWMQQAYPIVFGTNGSERGRWDSSGRLLVGTSTSASAGDSQYAFIQVRASTAGSTAAGLVSIQRGEAATSITTGERIGSVLFADNAGNEFASLTCEADANAGSGDYPGRIVLSTTADGASSPTERLRITSGGLVQIGGTSVTSARLNVVTTANERVGTFISQYSAASDAATFGLYIGKYSNDSTTTQRFIGFSINNDGNGNGQINANGASQAAFGSFSDERLKENIENLPSQLDNIKALRPVEFDYKDGSGHQLGFIAQEMQQVYPDVVSEQDGYLTITGFGKTECRLIKALQEAVAKIEALEAKVAALESA